VTGLGVTLLAGLVAALVLGTAAQRLRITPIVGFIAAGLVVGPFTPGFVADREQIFDLADIGVALLMFSLGLRFPLRQIASVGRPVLIAALLQVTLVTGIGYLVGTLIGLEWLEALFIGAIVSNSSSVVIVKIVGDEVVEGTVHGRIALAWSTIQDLSTVAIVVMLSSLAVGGDDFAVEVGVATAGALAFIAAVVFGGSRLFPLILGRLAAIGSREIFIIGVAVLAIGTSSAAGLVGISVALGAFVTGIALADSDLTDSVLGEIVPLRELFAAFFFVSIGLLVDPGTVIQGIPTVGLVLVLIIVLKGVVSGALSRLVGHPPPVATRVGAMLAQNGEFSFVLAVIGLELGVIGNDRFSLIMGAMVASIVLSGLVVRGGDSVARRLRAGDAEDAIGTRTERRRRHAVVLGYGRVGSTVARALRTRGFPFVVVDTDYELVMRAREEGMPILFGEAGNRTILDAADIDQALLLVVAVPDALATRQAVDYALERNPRLQIVARAHSESEEQHLRRRGVRRVVVAEREVGNELMEHALRRFGVSEREISPMRRRGPP
jgi:CPA2 family monovalent cation:H+ antiporter-2